MDLAQAFLVPGNPTHRQYEALRAYSKCLTLDPVNSDARLTAPMIKQGGAWKQVGWTTALEYVANGLKSIADGAG